MNKYDKITPEGTRDRLFDEFSVRKKAENGLNALYGSYGYAGVTTPGIEFYDVFSHGIGRVSQNELYTLTDNSGRLICLRPDSTKPIARLYASRLTGLPLPLRLFYNQSVMKRNVKLSKKSDEINQTGVELIGAGGFKADVEAVMLAAKSLETLFHADYFIEIGHTDLITSLIHEIDIEKKEELRQAIAAKNYPDIYRLAEEAGEKGEILKALPGLFGGEEVLEKADILFKDMSAKSAIKELRAMLAALKEGGAAGKVLIDLAVINEYEYYTGIVFKGYVAEGGEVLSGGRYDTLYGDYNLNVPAVGFAINIDEAVRVLLKADTSKRENGSPDVIVYTNICDIFRADAILSSYSAGGSRAALSCCDTLEETLCRAKAAKVKMVIDASVFDSPKEIVL